MAEGSKWIQFLRRYGPVPQNDNMYDESIIRSARHHGIVPIEFEHPMHRHVIECFNRTSMNPVSVVLTGTAGDGKTNLCRQVWKTLGGNDDDWRSDNPYLSMIVQYPPRSDGPLNSGDPGLLRSFRIHCIRDLSAWAPQQGAAWEAEKEEILQRFCYSLFSHDTDEAFLIAANDGQLVESWRRLKDTDDVIRARQLLEDMLVDDQQERPGVRLKLFNLSRLGSASLFDQAIQAFINHPGWKELREKPGAENDFFGPKCPIRHNYELLQTSLVQARIRSLLELCDCNGLHVPIRQILLLLSNGVLGHPDVKDHLMTAADVPQLIAAGTVSRASLFNNLFGGNLSESRRHSITIFDYFERFQVGYETSNRVDNILIFGQDDENYRTYFDEFMAKDEFYGADDCFYGAKKEYIEGTDEGEERTQQFLHMLVAQRRGLFFKIPKEAESELGLWELTVFKFAGEYLESVLGMLRQGNPVKRPILTRLVKGLNRVFTGMLINSDRELYLATSGNYSQARVSRILIERVSVEPSKGERVVLEYDQSNGRVTLAVYFSPQISVRFNLTLIRYEFLSRIALEGALPASFSKECYEDLLAFKSQLIAAFTRRQEEEAAPATSTIGLTLLTLTEQGMPDPKFVEIVP